MGDEVKSYPRGRLSKGAGDLIQVTDVTLRRSKGRKIIGTLRDPEAGVADGEHANEISFKAVLDEEGFERDYDSDFEKGTVSQYRLKVPGKTYALTGKIDDLEITSNVGGAIEFSAKVIGKNG
jgi:hypothetical protein